jgi:hypothetical protein
LGRKLIKQTTTSVFVWSSRVGFISDSPMSDPHLTDSGGGGAISSSQNQQSSSSLPASHQPSSTYAKALGGTASGTTSNLMKYAEIVAQQKSQRNVLEMKIKKITTTNSETNEVINPKYLTMDDISELIFDIINIKFEECVGVDYFTGRWDTKEIMMKPGVDTSNFITTEPITFKSHEIIVRKMLNDVTKVTFKNVPMYVPDEEILHLCGMYGTVVDNKVCWERLKISTSTTKGFLVSPTRYVMMNLNNGSALNNFYWMEGPMAGDPGRRVTVLHHGQK